MAKKYCLVFLFLSSFAAVFSSFTGPSKGEPANIYPDGSTETVITGTTQCAAADCTISGGNRAGNNLFHSFSEFSIPKNITVTFTDDGATNIFTRVSGGAASIDGTLAVTGLGNANFFLLSPQGITFGPQAVLVSSGSFIASTADSIVFSDEVTFSAVERATAGTPPLLTMSTPVGLQFGQRPGVIVHQSQASLGGALNSAGLPAGLQVSDGKTLALIGSSILLENGSLTASSGHIELGSVAANSSVSLSPEFVIGYEKTSNFQDVQLTGSSAVDVSGSQGSISIRGRNIALTETSGISNFTVGNASAGAIELIAEDTVNISGFGIFLAALPDSTSDGAALDIVARKLVVENGGIISGGTGSIGSGGNVTINASDSVELRGTSSFSPSLVSTSTQSTGSGGALMINTQRLSVTDGAQIQAVTYGSGKGGDLSINVTERIEVSGVGATAFNEQVYSGILASSGTEDFPVLPTGRGGSLTINTGVLDIDRGGQIAVNSIGSGDSGDLAVNARSVSLERGAQLTAAAAFGDGGNIRLENLEMLILRRGSTISAQAGTGDGQGNGGNIAIEADFIVALPLEDSDIVAKATQGRGGNIEINVLGLYGIEEQPAIAGNGTSDIDASSDFGISGAIAINRLGEETEQGLITLSERVLETDSRIGQGCQANGNRLVVTGRGGLPRVPTGAAAMDTTLVDLGGSYLESVGDAADSRDHSTPLSAIPTDISTDVSPPAMSQIEASRWYRNSGYQVVLTRESQAENLVSLPDASHCTG